MPTTTELIDHLSGHGAAIETKLSQLATELETWESKQPKVKQLQEVEIKQLKKKISDHEADKSYDLPHWLYEATDAQKQLYAAAKTYDGLSWRNKRKFIAAAKAKLTSKPLTRGEERDHETACFNLEQGLNTLRAWKLMQINPGHAENKIAARNRNGCFGVAALAIASVAGGIYSGGQVNDRLYAAAYEQYIKNGGYPGEYFNPGPFFMGTLTGLAIIAGVIIPFMIIGLKSEAVAKTFINLHKHPDFNMDFPWNKVPDGFQTYQRHVNNIMELTSGSEDRAQYSLTELQEQLLQLPDRHAEEQQKERKRKREIQSAQTAAAAKAYECSALSQLVVETVAGHDFIELDPNWQQWELPELLDKVQGAVIQKTILNARQAAVLAQDDLRPKLEHRPGEPTVTREASLQHRAAP